MTKVDGVVIGRNEGARLLACLASLTGLRRVVYVDSGSTDGSVAAANAAGAEVVALDLSTPFTAARARNAGLARLADDPPDFVQFLDGDCVLQPGWLKAARAGFDTHPAAAVICGRRRERFPHRSIYNRLIDAEWDTPIGKATACGGDALMRFAAVQKVGGYDPFLIAGEEPDLCLRLRRAGGEIWRIDAEMTLHDAAMTRFDQWWQRSRRTGHAFAEGATKHAGGPERHWQAETRRALIWGAALPLMALSGMAFHPAAVALLLAWPLQFARLAPKLGLTRAAFTVLGKLPEAQGVLGYHLGRMRGKRRGLIEYK